MTHPSRSGDPALPAVPGDTEDAADVYRDLECRTPGELLQALLAGQDAATRAVAAALPQLEAASGAMAQRLRSSVSGRLAYGGAGTSGRLAMLDGVELGPTFDWPEARLAFLLAGGEASLGRALEGAEDDRAAAAAAVDAAALGPADVLVVLAASGRTPYSCTLAEAARARGCLAVGVANNPETPLLLAADLPILLGTGPEVLAGSTRLAAGTAQKIALNLLSTSVMVALGKVFRGRMVDMRPTNAKLRRRAVRIVAEVAGCDREAAGRWLARAGDDIRAAILLAEASGEA